MVGSNDMKVAGDSFFGLAISLKIYSVNLCRSESWSAVRTIG